LATRSPENGFLPAASESSPRRADHFSAPPRESLPDGRPGIREGNEVREFYSQLPRPVLVGIEATGSMHWFLDLMEELGIGFTEARKT